MCIDNKLLMQQCSAGPAQRQTAKRNAGMTRQAGSALKYPALDTAAQPMQQPHFNSSFGQSYNPAGMATIPAYPMQYPGGQPRGQPMGQPMGQSMGQPMSQQQMMQSQYGGFPSVGYHAGANTMHGSMHGSSGQHKKGRMPAGQTNYTQQAPPQYAAALPVAHSHHGGMHSPSTQSMQGMNYAAMQQRADAVQQFQMQQYQQMEASMMQQLQHKQDHALLKYGNFEHAQYRQQDMQSRPEFRTY